MTGCLAKEFDPAASKQTEQMRSQALTCVEILNKLMRPVRMKDQGGRFVHELQELTDRLRQKVAKAFLPRAIRANRVALGP
jgi:hypothetical protein